MISLCLVGTKTCQTEVLKQLSAMGRLVVCAGDSAVQSKTNLSVSFLCYNIIFLSILRVNIRRLSPKHCQIIKKNCMTIVWMRIVKLNKKDTKVEIVWLTVGDWQYLIQQKKLCPYFRFLILKKRHTQSNKILRKIQFVLAHTGAVLLAKYSCDTSILY